MDLRRRMKMSRGGADALPGEVFGTNVQPLDVVFADANNELHIIHGLENWPSDCTPVGIVMIPGSHNRYGNTSIHGVTSLTYSTLSWATDNTYKKLDTSLTNYTKYEGRITYSSKAYILLPHLDSSNSLMYVYGDSNSSDRLTIAYPVNESGTAVTVSGGALSDFSGEVNTATLYSIGGSNYKVINAALQYSTAGIPSGSWYLPACGETSYLNFYGEKANTIIGSITTNYPSVTCQQFNTEYYDAETSTWYSYDSSTEYSSTNRWVVGARVDIFPKSAGKHQARYFTKIQK